MSEAVPELPHPRGLSEDGDERRHFATPSDPTRKAGPATPAPECDMLRVHIPSPVVLRRKMTRGKSQISQIILPTSERLSVRGPPGV